MNKVIAIIAHIFLLMSSLLAAPAWANNSIGEVYLIQGEVQAISPSGEVRTLEGKSQIYEGETLKTIGEGAVVFNLVDGTQWEMMDDSEMQIQKYVFSADKNTASADTAIYNLKQGNISYSSGAHGERKAKVLINTPDGKQIEPLGTEITFSMVLKVTVVQVVSGQARVSSDSSTSSNTSQILVLIAGEFAVSVDGSTQTFDNPQAAIDAFNQAVAATQQQGEQVTSVSASVQRIVTQANIALTADTSISVTQATTELDITVTTEPKDIAASPSTP